MDIFIHIPKTSGSTIRSVISRQYGHESVMYFEPKVHHDDALYRETLQSGLEKKEVKLLTGHHKFGVHRFMDEPCSYFAFVRDPVDRALSDFFYAYSYPHHRFRSEIIDRKIDVYEFISSAKFVAGDEQTDFIFGRPCNSPNLNLDEHMATHNMVVGVTGSFDASLMVLAKRFGWAPPLYMNRNVTEISTEHRRLRERCKEWATDNLKDQFQVDLELYDKCNSNLKSIAQGYGRKFEAAVDGLREIRLHAEAHLPDAAYQRYEFNGDDVREVFDKYKGSSDYRVIQDFLSSE